MSGLRRDICHRERPAASGFGCLRACVRRWLEHALDQGGVAVLHRLDELPVPRRLGRDAGVPAVRLGTTGSVASAPRTALREAAVTSMSAIGFMEPSVALLSINSNHGFDIAIKWPNARSPPPAHLSRGSPA